MPLDSTKVAMAMASGLSAVCATCRKYWEARDLGIPGDACTTKVRCGSPMAGDTFSDYDGPLKGSLHRWCFVCAGKAQFGIQVNGRPTTVGACVQHVRYAETFKAVNGPTPVIDVRSPGVIQPGQPSTKKSLGEAISEVETYYAKKEGREP